MAESLYRLVPVSFLNSFFAARGLLESHLTSHGAPADFRLAGRRGTRSFLGGPGATPATSGAIPSGSESARNIESRISECPSFRQQDNIGRPLRKTGIQTTYLLGGLVLPFAFCLLPFASLSGEWASKRLHVHLGGPLRHPNTFLGGPFCWHRADFRHVLAPG